MTTPPTDQCSSCRDYFRTVNGLIRDHDVRAGNPCCGSLRPPFVLVVPPWAEEAS